MLREFTPSGSLKKNSFKKNFVLYLTKILFQAVEYLQRYYPQFKQSPRIAASREKNRAMWRTTWLGAVKNRLKNYRLFRANYGTVIQYSFLAQPTKEKQSK